MNTLKIFVPFLFIAVAAFAQNSQPAGNRPPRPMFNPAEPGVHDPVMAKDGDTYHLYCTGRGISHFTSKDLKSWAFAKPVFQQAPAWIKEQLPDFRNSMWAPDILYYGNRFHLFYSCSAFAKNTSLIGHASAPSLDSTAVWTDHGMILQSVPYRDMWNAIDPNIIVDENGKPWMNFGSFWDGIKMVKLTDDLMAVAKPEEWKSLCRRPRTHLLNDANPGDGAVEAPFIFKHKQYYYLFVSYDYCCRGLKSDYNVVVGRSEKATGPYVDMNGVSLETGGGTVVLQGDEKWAAAGHNSVYTFDTTDYFIAHGYSKAENGASKLIVRVIEWDSQDWPVLTK